ncbi:MAG: hypothetical protein AAB339_11560 [Elusimicrobiota bacterium]
MHVVIVGPEAEGRRACAQALEAHGFHLSEFPAMKDASAGLEGGRSDRMKPDLFVLVRLPPAEALEAVRAVKGHPLWREAGILLVDDKLRSEDAGTMLDAGADDCYARAFLAPIFSARVRGLLRRTPAGEAQADPSVELRFGPGLRLRLLERQAAVDGAALTLSRRQFDLLVLLVKAKNIVVPAAPLIASLSKSMLYASQDHLKREIDELRSSLGRLGPWLSAGPSGGFGLSEPAPDPGLAAQEPMR